MSLKKKVFIVGISGQMGYALGCRLGRNYLVSGACFAHQVWIPGAQIFPISLDTPELLDALIRMQQPDILIYAAGVNDNKTIEQFPKLSENLNVVLPVSVATLAARIRAKFVFLGCASVFDGEKGKYREDSTDFTMRDPLGKQKMAAFSYIRSQTFESTTLRIGRVLSPGHPHRASLFDKVRFAAAAGKPFLASKRKTRSYVSAASYLEAFELVFAADFPPRHRLFHLGGANMTEFEMAESWFKLVGADSKLVTPIEDDLHQDLSLDSSQLASQFPPWQPETKERVLLHLLEELTPAVGTKKWRKTLQIP